MSKLVGNTSGLKASDVRRIERLENKGIDARAVVTPQLAQTLCEHASEIGRMVGLLINRKGNVEWVMIGEATRLYLPDIGRVRAGAQRLRGLRLIVAKPVRKRQSAKRDAYCVESDFITDLEKLQLDLVAQIEALEDGMPGRAATAALLPPHEAINGLRHKQEAFRQIHDIDFDFLDFVKDLEDNLTQKHKRTVKAAGGRETAILIGAYTSSRLEWEVSLEELKELAKTAGVHVVDSVVQQRKEIDPRTVVGKGKLEEICLHALHLGAGMLIFDRELSPSQLNAITDLTDLKVLDRTMLILDIFAQRAKSHGGQLQVELAQLKYSLPRLAQKQEGLSRLTGGIGGQGPGETKLEIDRRRAKDKVARLEREIDKLKLNRQLRRSKRGGKDVPVIAIVGYTNAGKSTLLNALTGSEVYVQNALFATLDPTSRRLRFPEEREVIITDTVGFIRNLPPTLLNAFRATLEELHEADLLLHVVDIADPERNKQIEVVEEILEELGLSETKRLIVLNKCDLLPPEKVEDAVYKLSAIAVSATTKQGFEKLLNKCASELWNSDTIVTRQAWA